MEPADFDPKDLLWEASYGPSSQTDPPPFIPREFWVGPSDEANYSEADARTTEAVATIMEELRSVEVNPTPLAWLINGVCDAISWLRVEAHFTLRTLRYSLRRALLELADWIHP